MPIPPRSELPAEYVELLDTWNLDWKNNFGRKPILPADSTPELLVTMAQRLDDALKAHSNTRAYPSIEPLVRNAVDACLARTLTEPVELHLHPRVRQDTDLHENPELSEALEDFLDRVTGKDNSTEDTMRLYTRIQLKRKKSFAEKHGLDLDLTDEEWLQL